VKPAAFGYALAASVDEALALLAEHGDEARVLAGGQSLAAMLNMRLVTPRVLVDISRIEALRRIRARDGSLQVGAAVTQAELAAWPALATAQPLLAQVLPFVGHYQTRQRGTVCGSLAHADPSSELPLALRVLGGEVVVRSRRRRRVLCAEAFQTGLMTTALEPDEMIVACRFPFPDRHPVSAFREVSRRHGDFAIVALAAVAGSDGVRLGAAGIAAVPRVVDLPRPGGAELADALNDFAWRLGGTDDQHATARYRRELLRRLAPRLISEVSGAIS